ncbi:universal stress protein [Streptomyces cyaneofuscatus]|uniref:universal stress protein n=1 Tax=Streptomyces TaxID=1883 RepID=UPI0022428261|nr:universal stress protein [Streptomyces sp. VB1]UZI34018.1 universal stress protein [Streptomyces sp. VB1]
MTRQPSHPARGRNRLARAGLIQPVAAVLTDRIDDVAVAETAARMAVARRVPLLLIAVMPPHTRRSCGPLSAPVRAVLARVMPKVGPHRTGYIPEVFHLPAGNGSRLSAAKQLLALATRHRAPDLVAARRGPAGLDARSMVEAASLRGGLRVHATAPAAWVPLLSSP